MTRKTRDYIIVDTDTGKHSRVKGDYKLSPNLAVWELVSDESHDVVLYSSQLVMRFQQIRNMVGRSITINSGFRSIRENGRVGGWVNSWHMYGRGMDLVIPKGYTVDGFHNVVLSVMGHNSGVGVYKGHVHIDNGGHYRKDWR